jgi:formate dehydrogenase
MHFSPAAIEPMGEAREEQHIFMELAARMGLPNPVAMTLLPEELWEEHKNSDQITLLDMTIRNGMLGDKYGENPDGLSLDLVRQHPHGLEIKGFNAYGEWRRHARHEEGKLVLWNDLIAGDLDRLRQEGIRLKPKEGQLRLFGRRSVKNINSWMHNVQGLVQGQQPALYMHPDDAQSRGISDGQSAVISGKHRELTCLVKITDEVVPGAVCYPHGWGHGGQSNWSTAKQTSGININDIISSDVEDLDPLTGSPLLDGHPVSVTAVSPVA